MGTALWVGLDRTVAQKAECVRQIHKTKNRPAHAIVLAHTLAEVGLTKKEQS